ncbi:MAG: transketolase C-terminal domain-containing protein, partial [Patescibacteria group bacterium]
SKIHNIIGRGRVSRPVALIISAGVTLYEALKAQKELVNKDIETVVLDCYSVKPLDVQSINRLTKEIKNVVVVEDHYPSGGIGEAVLSIIDHPSSINFVHLCVRKLPRSGSPEELLRYEEIDSEAIIKAVKGF